MHMKTLNLRKKQQKYCPFIKGIEHQIDGDEIVKVDDEDQCREKITQSYFKRICNSPNHVECKKFAKKMNALNIPIAWLQREAIKKAKIEKKNEEASKTE